MSGFNSPSFLMHSAPLRASPTIAISFSESKSLRRPSRKMAWSSAISSLILVFDRTLAIRDSSIVQGHFVVGRSYSLVCSFQLCYPPTLGWAVASAEALERPDPLIDLLAGDHHEDVITEDVEHLRLLSQKCNQLSAGSGNRAQP